MLWLHFDGLATSGMRHDSELAGSGLATKEICSRFQTKLLHGCTSPEAHLRS